MKFTVLHLSIGKIKSLSSGKREVQSAYSKSSVASAVLGKNGFLDDEQADLKHHGGLDKAVCAYSMHHFPAYENFLGNTMPIPAFGENFTIDKADEEDIYIGDIFECGEVKLEISQPRQPCFKTGMYHNNNGVIKFMADQGSTGFYFRVIEEGTVKQGDSFSRTHSDEKFSLAYGNDFMYGRNKNIDEMAQFISHPALSLAWKDELGTKIK